MSHLHTALRRSTLPLLLVVCLAAISFSYAIADETQRPLAATDILGSPDAAVNGKFAVGSASVGAKALTVSGVIDFLGAGTVHNYFTQGSGNNMQINTNVDEANTVGDASRSQWKLVLGSNLDWFSIRRSPAGATYNEDAQLFIEGSTGNVGIATVDTGNGATIPFTFQGRLHVESESGHAIWARTAQPGAVGVYGNAVATLGSSAGVIGISNSATGRGVEGYAMASTGQNYGVRGLSDSTVGLGVEGVALATTGFNYGVYGRSQSDTGTGVLGEATSGGINIGVYGRTVSTEGTAVFGWATGSTGTNYGVFGRTSSSSGYGVYFLGGLAGSGTKSAIVETQDYGWRHLYAVESPQNWFEDFGEATLSAGEAVVSVEPIFAQTVNLDLPYHVFLTPLDGFCSLYVTQQTASSFTVRAQEGSGCEIAFHYRIIAARLDYEDLRLKPAEDPQAVAANIPPASSETLAP